LLAIVVVFIAIVVIVVIAIVVIANPPCGTIEIATAIRIAAPSLCIIGSAMAMALLFLGGWAINI
jgi:hypothetical protein